MPQGGTLVPMMFDHHKSRITPTALSHSRTRHIGDLRPRQPCPSILHSGGSEPAFTPHSGVDLGTLFVYRSEQRRADVNMKHEGHCRENTSYSSDYQLSAEPQAESTREQRKEEANLAVKRRCGWDGNFRTPHVVLVVVSHRVSSVSWHTSSGDKKRPSDTGI
ncbi:hypothetical protein J6590_025431 [Homalodisca vitripennis]|nr:hypothetical protein J6590_025431 [Homalodisca vitripennis]